MLVSDWKAQQRIVSRLIAKAWIDETFKQRFIDQPAAVLQEAGVTLPDDVQVSVNPKALLTSITNLDAHPGSDLLLEIPLPPKPAALNDDDLHAWANEDVEPPGPCIAPCC